MQKCKWTSLTDCQQISEGDRVAWYHEDWQASYRCSLWDEKCLWERQTWYRPSSRAANDCKPLQPIKIHWKWVALFLVHSTHCLCLSKVSIHALPRRPSSLSFWVSNHAFWGLLLKLQTVLELIELNRWMSNCMTPAVLFFSSCWNGFDLCDQTRGFDPFVQSQVTKNFNQDCGIQACGRWGWTRPHLRVRLGTSQWRDSWKPDFMILFLEKTKCKGQLEVVVLRNKQDQANVKLFRRTLRWI